MDYLKTTFSFPFPLPLIVVAGNAGKSGQSCFVPFRKSRERLKPFDDEELVVDQEFWIDEELPGLKNQTEKI